MNSSNRTAPHDATDSALATTSRALRHCLRFAATTVLAAGAATGPVTALASDFGPVRPMGGSCTTTFEFTSADTSHIEADCRLLNVGAAKAVSTQSAVQQPDGTLLLTNDIVYTTAKGDTLNSNFVGVGVFTTTGLAFSGTETYRRGTGRFAKAIGSVALEGSAQFTSQTAGVGEFRTIGFISY